MYKQDTTLEETDAAHVWRTVLQYVSSCRFIHQYQPMLELLQSLNKTPLCQCAAAASEMPYMDLWPSVEGL